MSANPNRLVAFLPVSSALALLLAAGSPLQAADENAGTWKMIALSSSTQISVPAPAPVIDPSYTAELSVVKNAQATITPEQRELIDQWSKGGIVAWNKYLISLVARADLPPEPNADGTYSFPSAATPFAFPQFPFANPPYAARSYSYVSVAMYEALKVAWYYKYAYSRPAPSDYDSGVKALAPTGGVPSYPSEDAVVSAVNGVLLKVLFPVSADEIDRKVAEHQQVALLSGRATPSDIAAGIALGQAVAAVFVARAGADGLRNATGAQAQWDALAAAAAARGEIPWKSLEIPPRPPMLPFFGAVQAWMMTPGDIAAERPGPPPSTSSPQMKQELEEVRNTVRNLTRAQMAIGYKWADGASSPTPPGHWNLIADDYISRSNFTEVRAARVLALVNMALHDAAVACWDAKYAYFNPRPSQLDPAIRTVIGLPNFPSFESGHSAFSGAAAAVLSYLFPGASSDFEAMRDEAAISRLYAGIHYRSDIEVGKVHGRRIGAYTVTFAQNDGADK